jgi:SNF2 family DNA or RNA helicase
VPDARTAILDFVQAAVDDYAGGVAHYDPTPLPRAATPWPPEAKAWAEALGKGETAFKAPARAIQRLAEEIGRWTSALALQHHGAYRTCFRLEPPARRKGWTLEILAQASDDPSLLRPAADLYDEGRAERLLADLGRAVRVFPPLSRALRQARPKGLALEMEEAAAFLRETSWVLEDSGFGVLIPGERLTRTDPIKATLRVRPGEKRGDGKGFGLDAIVDYDWALSLGGEAIDPDEFRRLAARKVPLVEIRGQWVLLDPTQVERTLRVLDGTPQELTIRDAVQATMRAADAPLTVAFEGALGDAARFVPLDPPPTFHGELRPYQRRGFSWLAFLLDRGLGACLADDMGLGKTIQVIALLLHRKCGRPSLLVCPTSLVGNWQREIARFAPSLSVGVHHGAERRKKTDLTSYDLVLTTYALVNRDEKILGAREWEAVILDEAQNVKNPDAGQSKAVRRLKAKARIAMSGTPVENRLSDLWSLMEFLNPGMLGPRETFRRHFAIPIERWGDATRAERLRSATAPFLLRRLKTDKSIIADLPEKQEMKVYCPLTREQATLYQATLDSMLRQIEESEGVQRKGLVLSTLMRLKQICDHPAVFLQDGSALESHRSGKLQRLEEMLEEVVESGDRALIFTQFAAFGERLRRVLSERLAVPSLFLSGATPRKARDGMVARFQSDDGPPLFILSLKAGGVGLNLTRASHVFHVDRWWNPAVENQATDRAFRIGQRRNVQVHKLICQGTLEEAIDAMIERKTALAEQVVGSGEGWLTELDTRQLGELLRLQPDAVEEGR